MNWFPGCPFIQNGLIQQVLTRNVYTFSIYQGALIHFVTHVENRTLFMKATSYFIRKQNSQSFMNWFPGCHFIQKGLIRPVITRNVYTFSIYQGALIHFFPHVGISHV